LHHLSYWLYGHFLSFFLYGHGVKLKYPILTGLCVILISAIIYSSGGQVNSFYPDGIKLSLKIFISTTQVVNQAGLNLSGICEWVSIAERFFGTILIITSLVVLAKKLLR